MQCGSTLDVQETLGKYSEGSLTGARWTGGWNVGVWNPGREQRAGYIEAQKSNLVEFVS